VFQNGVLGATFWPKRRAEKGAGESCIMRHGGHDKWTNAYNILEGKHEGFHLKVIGVDGRTLLK
jgi:hypothetical protein